MNTLKELRLDFGYTQIEVAHTAMVGYSTYTKLEQGMTFASSEVIERLAEFFGVERDDLVSALRETKKQREDGTTSKVRRS